MREVEVRECDENFLSSGLTTARQQLQYVGRNPFGDGDPLIKYSQISRLLVKTKQLLSINSELANPKRCAKYPGPR